MIDDLYSNIFYNGRDVRFHAPISWQGGGASKAGVSRRSPETRRKRGENIKEGTMVDYLKGRISWWSFIFLFIPVFFTGCAVFNGGKKSSGSGDCEPTSITAGAATYQGCMDHSVRAFKGIRYAAAERWRAPVAVNPSGHTPAQNYAAICPQNSKCKGKTSTMSEDCLFLNVWTPSDAEDLPVMVFIHGGSFLRGSGSSPVYNGANLAEKHGIVMVTLNYRLGVLGYHYNEDKASGNFGIQDQIMAFEWVHDKISAFGGDPKNVTIVGESAGSMSVGIHLAIDPESELFQKAVMESPYNGIFYKSSKEAEKIAKVVELSSKLRGKHPKKCTVKELLEIQKETIFTLFSLAGLENLFVFSPYIEEYLLKEQPVHATIEKPVIIGNNKDEATLFISKDEWLINDVTYYGILKVFFGESASDIYAMKRYHPKDQGGAYHAFANVMNDGLFVCATDYLLNRAHPPAGNAYGYAFDYRGHFQFWPDVPACKKHICHAAELPYVFDNPYDWCGDKGIFSEGDPQMAEEMGAWWADFVKHGSPGETGAAPWKPYKKAGRYTIPMNSQNPYEDDGNRNCGFWADHIYKKDKEATKGLIQRILEREKTVK